MALALRGVNSGNAPAATTDWSISLTALTGGSGSTAQTGDIVVLVISDHYPADGTAGISVNTSGYTAIDGGGIWSNDSRDTNARLFYKVMGATPDTTVSVHDGNSGGDVSGVCVVHVWSGVDTTTPMDVTTTKTSGGNTGTPNPPSITPVTAGAIVLAVGSGSSTSAQTPTAPTGYSNLKSASQVQSSQASTSAIASKAWSGSGAEDPGTFGSMSTSTSDSWVAYTVALRPAASGPANMKSYDTNTKSNIKSINTNPIANIKSFDTNA